MFVRMKIGKYAGEVREVKFADGQQLVRLHRAEVVDVSGSAITPPVAQPAPALVPAIRADAKRGLRKKN